MKKVYCSNSRYGNLLPFIKVADPGEADIRVIVIEDSTTAMTLAFDLCVCKEDPLHSYVCIETHNMLFSSAVREIFSAYTRNIFNGWVALQEVFDKDARSHDQYSIYECIVNTGANYGVDMTDEEVRFLEDAVRKFLKKYSVYTCALALHQMFRKHSNVLPTTYETVIRYFAEVYKQAGIADEKYRETGSHLDAILATGNVFYTGHDKAQYERIVMHTMFEPYTEQDRVPDRVEMLVRMVREKQKRRQ